MQNIIDVHLKKKHTGCLLVVHACLYVLAFFIQLYVNAASLVIIIAALHLN